MAPEVLGRATKTLPEVKDPRLIVGFHGADDAGVVRLDDERALVQTVDFFTPVVDDPHTYGRIAAANALSDVYAMGGVPLSALNILCFPEGALPEWVLEAILAGGQDAVTESGALLVGGHSVRDKELKFGMSVTGVVHPERCWTNAGAQPGDCLILTKALGTGVLTTALKRGVVDRAAIEPAVRSMAALNRGARDAAVEGVVHGATDVTGFGLGGHGWEMARASGVTLEFWWSSLPLLPGALEAAEAGAVPGGTKKNRRYPGDRLTVDPACPSVATDLLLDPQTSGGLLLAVPASERHGLQERLNRSGCISAWVGQVREGPAAVRLVAQAPDSG